MRSAEDPDGLVPWRIDPRDGAIVGVALHNGHHVSRNVERHLAISPTQRLREEDPLTGIWTQAADSRICVFRSRFEVDLNRPRDKAVAARPEDVWGLELWSEQLPDETVAASLREYDLFYAQVDDLLKSLLKRHPRVLVLDLHSYNHRRGGPQSECADPNLNPDINIGTGTMQSRDRWKGLIDTFMASLQTARSGGKPLDVRENVKFFGGYFPKWLHQEFPESVCALSIECKKFFMDEWSGTADIGQLEALRVAFERAVASVRPLM